MTLYGKLVRFRARTGAAYLGGDRLYVRLPVKDGGSTGIKLNGNVGAHR